jgi:all-trans-retinol dehydrogenase (NAD+)
MTVRPMHSPPYLPPLTSLTPQTASSASYMSIPQLSEYSCSKAAALALHEVLTAELVHRYNAPRVRTSVICPTKVATQMGNAMEEQENQ